MEGRQLTTDEQAKRLTFIGECVEANAVLPTSLRFGQTSNMTIQDLCNSSVDTLKKVGQGLEAIQQKNGASRFSAQAEAKVGGFPISKWVDFVELTAIKKLWEASQDQKQTKLKRLREQLEQFKTPGEKRTELEREIAELEGVTVQHTEAAPATA